MKWDLKIRNETHTLTSVDALRAVSPTPAFSAKATLDEYAEAFGDVMPDGAEAVQDQALPANERRIFENAGWWFVAPNEQVKKAAELREKVPEADAAREVYVSESGEALMPTERATVQLPEDMTDAQAQQTLKDHHLEVVDKFTFAKNMYEVRIPPGRPIPEVIDELQASGSYVVVEPIFLQAVKVRGDEPEDPNFSNQWQHKNVGAAGGIAGEDLKSIAAWKITKGAGVRIAVIDTGMQIDHPDLVQGITSGGFFTTTPSGGAAFVKLTPGMDNFPDSSHGTFCLGMAGARSNPAGDLDEGGCGAAPEATLMAIACADNLVTTQATLARAVHFAAQPSAYDPAAGDEDAADVISCSLDTNKPLLTVLKQAIAFAAEQGRKRDGVALGTPIFWAISNNSFSMINDPVCTLPEVIAVGRHTHRGMRDRGAFGAELSFLAPGVRVYSTRSHDQHGQGDGTSFATALAAGVGALVLSLHPEWTAAQVRDKLRESCNAMTGINGHSQYSGFGKLNAHKAVS